MSKYTTEVRYICEYEAGLTESGGFDDINTIITTAAPKIFNFSFPIFDEQYRLPLEIKILRHYYTREICEETVGLWKLRLQDTLNLIMPYYNKLYQSELLSFNPLYDVDLTRDHTLDRSGTQENTKNRTEKTDNSASKTISSETTTSNTNEGESESTQTVNGSDTRTSDSTRWNLYSDTPQGGINGITNATTSLTDNTYLTNATKETLNNTESGSNSSTSNTEQSSTITDNGSTTLEGSEASTFEGDITESITDNSEITSTDEYVEHVRGKQGGISYSQMLKDFRNTFLNIDQMVIDDLKTLFFGLW